MAGYPEVSTGWPLRPDVAYQAALAPYDGVRHVGRSKAAFLFQFGTHDGFVSRAQAEQFIAAAPAPKRVLWYEADHALGSRALPDRASWLSQQLGFPPSDLTGVGLPTGDRIKHAIGKRIYALLRRPD
jgi:fermentation-respiration switch protein FrsA (DUF1100 family)